MKAINDLTRYELKQLLAQQGQPAYRATQICEWLHKRRVRSFDEMTNLPVRLRDHLGKHFSISRVSKQQEVVSPEDGATKFLLELGDGNTIESVYLPHKRGATLCISTQVGCGLRCRFCATGRMGLKRNLSPGEIVDQVNFANEYMGAVQPGDDVGGSEIEAGADDAVDEAGADDADAAQAGAGIETPEPTGGYPSERAFSNLVFMGMGEPLANYDNLVKAIEILINEMGVGARRLTVSTAGLADKMMRLATVPYEISLAISLNSPFDEERRELMPVVGKTPLAELLSAARYYFAKKNRMVTFEYVLIGGVNDSVRHAHALAGLIREIPAKINLIAFNPFPGCRYERPESGRVHHFQAVLTERGKKVTLRRSLGCDILAGCGQLGAAAGKRGGTR